MRQPARPSVLDDHVPMWRLMATFLIPLVASNVLQALSSTLNAIYVGRLLGVHALASLSAFFPALFFLISFVIGISSGSTVLIGQAWGARDLVRMRQVAGTTLSLTFALGIIVAAFGAAFDREFLLLVGTPPDILGDAIAYSRIIFYSLPIFFLYLVYTTFLRGTGDSATPFYFLIVSTVTSLVITPIFILGWLGAPRLGVQSAAVASFFASALGLIAMLVYLVRARHPLAPDREMLAGLRPNPRLVAQIVRIGIPTGVQLVMVSLSEIAVLAFVNAYGSDATAAYGAVNQVVSYVQFPAISIGIASSIFGAQTIGAGRLGRLRSVVRSGVTLNYIVSGILIVIVYTFSWQILGWFLTSSRTLGIAHGLLTITLWSYALFGNSSVLSGIMRSSGSVLWPTAISIAGIWGIEVPVAYVLSHRIGIDGVWIGYPVAYCCILALQTAYYQLVWRKREIRAIR